jgi:formate/nitrite transporter FocA (FNT family)
VIRVQSRRAPDLARRGGLAWRVLRIAAMASTAEREAHEHQLPPGEVVYRAVRQDGDDALTWSADRLWWSGLAAGVSMGFSLAVEGLLRAHLPEAQWTPLVTKLGYSVGFVIVVLGRQQLFTEQTLTAVLPLLSRDRPDGVIASVGRMWLVVLVANIAGTAGFALTAAWTGAFDPEVRAAFAAIGQEAMSHAVGTTLVRGILAGFLIATMIWLLPGSGSARLWIVVLMTYVVGLAGLSHIIAGSAEALYLVFIGERALSDYLLHYFAPTVTGNAIGGVVLVAILAHAQHAPEESR